MELVGGRVCYQQGYVSSLRYKCAEAQARVAAEAVAQPASIEIIFEQSETPHKG